jgi:uncharacterized membrane protein YkvA (DUF1232 family)
VSSPEQLSQAVFLVSSILNKKFFNMSREKHLKRLKASLSETQSILGDLIAGTSKDAGKRLTKANKRLQHTYDDASSELDALLKESTKDVQKQYASTRKDLQKQYASTRKDLDKQAVKVKDQLGDRYDDARAAAKSATANLKSGALKSGLGAGALALAAKADIPSRAANVASFLAKTGLAAKVVELAGRADLKSRTSNLLENAAGGLVAARNRINPDKRLVLRNEKDKWNRVSTAGYFARFTVLAIVIISKREKLMSLAKDLYSKIQEKGITEALTSEAKQQYNTMRRLITAYANGQYREFPIRSLVKIVAGVVYFVSVVDLIPDFIPILGLTDDLAILAWVYASVKDDLQQFVDWEAAEEKRKGRLAKQSGDSASGVSATSGMGASSAGVANVGNASSADRQASPNVSTSTGSETGSKATVTTGTSGSGSAAGTGSSTSGGSMGGSNPSAGRGTSPGGPGGSNKPGGNMPS